MLKTLKRSISLFPLSLLVLHASFAAGGSSTVGKGGVVRAVGWRRRADQSRRSNRRLSGWEGSFRIISSNSTGVR
jgi:hypothetical protein